MGSIKDMQYLELKSLTQKTQVLDLGTGLGRLYLNRYFDSQLAPPIYIKGVLILCS